MEFRISYPKEDDKHMIHHINEHVQAPKPSSFTCRQLAIRYTVRYGCVLWLVDWLICGTLCTENHMFQTLNGLIKS